MVAMRGSIVKDDKKKKGNDDDNGGGNYGGGLQAHQARRRSQNINYENKADDFSEDGLQALKAKFNNR